MCSFFTESFDSTGYLVRGAGGILTRYESMEGYVSDSLNTGDGGKALWSNTVLLPKSHGTGGVTLVNAECNVQAEHVFLALELKSKGFLF